MEEKKLWSQEQEQERKAAGRLLTTALDISRMIMPSKLILSAKKSLCDGSLEANPPPPPSTKAIRYELSSNSGRIWWSHWTSTQISSMKIRTSSSSIKARGMIVPPDAAGNPTGPRSMSQLSPGGCRASAASSAGIVHAWTRIRRRRLSFAAKDR